MRSISGRVLVLHAGALGDCVLAVHLVGELARVVPEAQFTLAARSSIARWACRRFGLPEALSIDAVDLYRDAFRNSDGAGVARRGAQPGELVAGHKSAFDMVISLLGDPSSDVAGRLDARAGVPVIHVDSRISDSGTDTERHVVEQWLGRLRDALGGQFGPGGRLAHSDVSFDRTRTGTGARSTAGDDRHARAELERRLAATERGRPVVLVHPGSGGTRKCAPLEEVESLVARLTPETTTGWMVGPDEVERLGDGLVARLRRTAPVIYEEDAGSAADLIAAADAFVGFDAGMTHVAALSGITTIALFGPTNPLAWRPLGPAVSVVRFGDAQGARGAWIDAVARAIRRATGGPD